jgi:hypothetical protein
VTPGELDLDPAGHARHAAFRSAGLLLPAFAVAILLNVASYLFILHPPDVLGAREIAAVPPQCAGLAAARAGRGRRGRRRRGYLGSLGLTVGQAGYWEANSTTLASGGRVHVRGAAVAPDGKLMAYEGRPTTRDTTPRGATPRSWWPAARLPLPWAQAAALRIFGPPDRTCSCDGYTIMTWNKNLLRHLVPHPGATS